MDSNNWRPTQGGEPPMDTGDWRTQLQADSRHRIVNKIEQNGDLEEASSLLWTRGTTRT
ncbi:hypothetical protein LguiB_010723 [Lonicera macranthoides]